MDYVKLTTEACLKVGLSKRRSKELGSEISANIKKELEKKKGLKDVDVTEIKDTYEIKDVKEKKKKKSEV